MHFIILRQRSIDILRTITSYKFFLREPFRMSSSPENFQRKCPSRVFVSPY